MSETDEERRFRARLFVQSVLSEAQEIVARRDQILKGVPYDRRRERRRCRMCEFEGIPSALGIHQRQKGHRGQDVIWCPINLPEVNDDDDDE